jgi:hypothetical protein
MPYTAKAALLVIDMQEYFEGVAYPILKNVIDHACRKWDENRFYKTRAPRSHDASLIISKRVTSVGFARRPATFW